MALLYGKCSLHKPIAGADSWASARSKNEDKSTFKNKNLTAQKYYNQARSLLGFFAFLCASDS
jgi:hypothetical protein